MYSPNIQYIFPNKQRNPVTNTYYKSETANPNESTQQNQLVTAPLTPFSEKQQNGITKTYIKKHGTFSNYIPALYTNIQNINQSLVNALMNQNICPHISKQPNSTVITQKPDTLETQRSKALTTLPDYKVVQYPHQPPNFDDKLILEKGPKHTSRTTDVLLMEKINLIRNNMYYNVKKTNNGKPISEKMQNLKSGQNAGNESPKKITNNEKLKSPQSERNRSPINVQHKNNQNTKKEQDNKNEQNVKNQQKHNTNSKENTVKNVSKVQSKNNNHNTGKEQGNKTAQNDKNKRSQNNVKNIGKESSTKNVQNMQNKKNVQNIKDRNSMQNSDKEQVNKNVQKEKKTQNIRNNSLIKEGENNNKSKIAHPEGQNIQNPQNVQEKKLTENSKNEKKEEKPNNNSKKDSGKQNNQTPEQKQNITNAKNSVNVLNGNQKSMSVQNNSLIKEGENNNKSKIHLEGPNCKQEKKEEKPSNTKQDSGKQSNQTPQNKQNITNAKNNAPNGNQKSMSIQNNSLIKEGENNIKSKIAHPEGQNIQNTQNVQEKKLIEKNSKNEKKEENNNTKQDSGKQNNVQTPQNKQNNANNAKNSVNTPNIGVPKSMSTQNNSLIKENGNNNKSNHNQPHPEGQNIQTPQNVQERKLNEKNSKNEKKDEKFNNNNIKQDSGKQSNQTPQNKQNVTNTQNSANVTNSNKKYMSKNTPNSNNSQNSTSNKNKDPNSQIQSESTNEETTKNTNTPITEIYKCNQENFIGSSENLNDDDTSLQKVTQDLTTIIKNLQKQIQAVPLSNKSNNMEQIPSALIQTKTKEFFKKPTAKQNTNAKTLQSTPKTSTNTRAPSKPSTTNSKQSSFASVSNYSTKTSNSSIKSYSHSRNSSSSSSASFMSANRSLATSSSTSRRGLMRSSLQNIDPVKVLKEEVQRAIRARKTFTVRGFFYTIRRALRRRGWIEKFHLTQNMTNDEVIKRYQKCSINELIPLLKKPDVAEQCKDIIRSKLLGAYQVDFYWAVNVDEAFRENPDKIKLTIINKLKRDIFSYTNKQGLCDASKDSYWYQKKNVSKLNHPRSYSLAAKTGDVKGFIEDFRITAAMSLLKWIIMTSITKESKLISPSGKIPLEVFDFAINECCKFIKKRKHEDIDTTIPEASEKEWDTFLDYFYKIIHYSNHFTEEKREKEDSLVRKSNYVINTLREVWPYTDMDGMMNIWILKPVASSRGRGIHMCRTLQYALKVLKDNNNVRYIIQKYIERPLLIHNTKFDIRQWFLISNCSPLTIWIYKHCYLRFSSQTYNLRKLHESIHLTNNSVQCKYRQNFIDTTLPNYNMWDSNQFKTYLANIGYPNAYRNIIYPGMKQCITAAVLMHQDKMVIRRNCFELYGADFMLTEDFQPWLLEINSNPALQPSTPVTSRMCPRVLEDVIKVIIDYSRNVKADTGGFELIYKQQIVKLPAPAKLQVTGKPLNKNYFNPSPDEKKQSISNKFNAAITPDKKQENLKNFTEEIKKTLKNLLDIIHEERLKRERQNKNDKRSSPLPTKVQNKQIKT